VQSPTSLGTSVTAAEAPVLPDFKPAQHVFHPKFGAGTVVEVLELKNDAEVAVEFARHGKKRLMASLARLEIVDQG
jgi:DNA helicase-2/ATP-dependent DNA helicase PcrA